MNGLMSCLQQIFRCRELTGQGAVDFDSRLRCHREQISSVPGTLAFPSQQDLLASLLLSATESVVPGSTDESALAQSESALR